MGLPALNGEGEMRLVLLLGLLVAATRVFGATTNNYYVNLASTNPVVPYTAWETAATNVQDAVNEAQKTVGASTFCLVQITAGVYRLPATLLITNGITVRGVMTNREDVVLDGRGAVRCVMMTNANAVLENVRVANGFVAPSVNNASEHGGGIRLHSGTVRFCTIANNIGRDGGGGVVLFSSGAVVTNCVISGNVGGFGGGVNQSAGLVVDCLITGNNSTNYSDGYGRGGGFYQNTAGLVLNCIISSNQASTGGGIYCGTGGEAKNLLIVGNKATRDLGGGVRFYSSKLVNCTIVGNTAPAGGGISHSGGSAWPRNVICYYNTATLHDDNYYIAGSGPLYNSCTYPLPPYGVGNIDRQPDFVDLARGDYRLLPGSPCIDMGAPTDAPVQDLDHKARPIDGDGNGTVSNDMGVYEADAAAAGDLRCGVVADVYKGFGPLSVTFTSVVAGADRTGIYTRWDFGNGMSQDWSTAPTASLTYEAGTYDVTLWVSNASGYVASNTRPACIQAAPAVVYVATAGTHVFPFDTWGKAATNLQAAIDAALDRDNLQSQIMVSGGVYAVSQEILLYKKLRILGVDGPRTAELDGQYPLFTNRVMTMSRIGAVLDGFTLCNGDAGAGVGGGLTVYGGIFQNGAVTNCRAPVNGGGVYAYNGSVISNVVIGWNKTSASSGSTAGGGIQIEDSLLVDSAVVSNYAGGGYGRGAGICNARSTVERCLIFGNTAQYEGGGYYIGDTAGWLRNSVVASNSAPTGGGISAFNGTVESCWIVSNRTTSVSGDGGGAFLNTKARMNSCVVAANQSLRNGGGVFSKADLNLVWNSTIAGNWAKTAGGGLYQEKGTGYNVIVYYNVTNGIPSDVGGPAVKCYFSCAANLANDPDGTGNRNAAPQFKNAGSGSGVTYAGYALQLKPGSPGVDTGTNSAWMTGSFDLAGDPRILPAGGTVNMGAFEKTAKVQGSLLLVR